MFTATLSGCFGEQTKETKEEFPDFQINFTPPDSAVLKTGEWNEFLLVGEGRAISVPNNVLLFIDDTLIPNGYAMVEGNQINGKLLPTPYAENVRITIVEDNGKGKSFDMELANGTPIISGAEWFEKMDFITSVCSDSTQCGGYINRWMGSPNPAFE